MAQFYSAPDGMLRRLIAIMTCGIAIVFALSAFAPGRSQIPASRSQVGKETSNVPEELVIFARFHALQGKEDAVASELRDTVARTRVEPGCLSIEAYRSVRDPRLFWLNAHWTNEAAFDTHAALPATNQFVERAERLIDHPFDVTRTRLLE